VLIGRSHPFVWVSPLRADTFLFGIFTGVGTSVGAFSRRMYGFENRFTSVQSRSA
jgi:hypothetical protein